MIFYISIIICLLGGIQGIILAMVLHQISKKYSGDFKWLTAFIILVSITLIGRLLFVIPSQLDPRWSILTDLVVFVYGPLYFFFVQSTYGISIRFKKLLPHLIPSGIHIAIILPQFVINIEDYIKFTASSFWLLYVFGIIFLGVLHNSWYWFKSLRFFNSNNINIESDGPKYLVYAKWLYVFLIAALAISSILVNINYLVAVNIYQVSWIVASWLIYMITYYVLISPESFGDYLLKSKNLKRKIIQEKERTDELVLSLKNVLENEKIYIDPNISLLKLARRLSTNNVLLSKTINNNFNSNFYDLINEYRVKEFINLVKNNSNTHLTYFGIASKAGFNSKTSFNKYFKKYTQKTPREYFEHLKNK